MSDPEGWGGDPWDGHKLDLVVAAGAFLAITGGGVLFGKSIEEMSPFACIGALLALAGMAMRPATWNNRH